MLVRDIMSKNLITVSENDSLDRAAQLMRQYDVGILPVVKGKALAGVITDRDMVTRALAVSENAQSKKVGECMSKCTVCASPTQDVEDVMKLMALQQIRRVPVTECGELCGMISLGDISKSKQDTEVAAALCEISKP